MIDGGGKVMKEMKEKERREKSKGGWIRNGEILRRRKES